MKQLAEDTLKWCDQVLEQAKGSLDALQANLEHDTGMAELENLHYHRSCDAAICMVK